MARRRTNQFLFSLFMFQDIITCVTGIMILITLILGLEFITRISATPAGQTNIQSIETSATVAELKHEIALTEAAINSDHVALNDLPSLDADDLLRRANELADESKALDDEIKSKTVELHDKERKLQDEKAGAARNTEQAQAEIKSLENAIKDGEEKLKQIETGTRVFYKSGVRGKTTWIVEISAKGYRIGRIGVAESPRLLSMSELITWVQTLDRSTNAFLMVLKPKGKAAYERCRTLLADDLSGGFGFDVGLHVVAEDQVVLDPETGAGQK